MSRGRGRGARGAGGRWWGGRVSRGLLRSSGLVFTAPQALRGRVGDTGRKEVEGGGGQFASRVLGRDKRARFVLITEA